MLPFDNNLLGTIKRGIGGHRSIYNIPTYSKLGPNFFRMITRRNFITSSLSFSVSLVCMPLKGLTFNSGPIYRRTLESPARFFDGEGGWTHPRIGIIPHRRRPVAVLTMSKLDLEGSDVFREMVGMHTTDFPEYIAAFQIEFTHC